MDIDWLARASVPAERDSPREPWGDSAAWSEDSVGERDFAKSRGSEGRGAARERRFAAIPESGPHRNSRHRRSAATRQLPVLDLPAGTRPKRMQAQPAARAQPPAEISTAFEMTDRGLVLSANYPHGSPPPSRGNSKIHHRCSPRNWKTMLGGLPNEIVIHAAVGFLQVLDAQR